MNTIVKYIFTMYVTTNRTSPLHNQFYNCDYDIVFLELSIIISLCHIKNEYISQITVLNPNLNLEGGLLVSL